MFCKKCGTLMLGNYCRRCQRESEGENPKEIQGKDGLTELEIRRQEHIQRQRKKQSIWVVPDD